MITYYFKKYNIITLAVVYSLMLTGSVQCMKVKLSLDTAKNISQTVFCKIQETKPLIIYSLIVLSQLPIVNAYEPGTKAFCYSTCAQNCSVTIDRMCDLSVNDVILPLSLTALSLLSFGTCVGCLTGYWKDT